MIIRKSVIEDIRNALSTHTDRETGGMLGADGEGMVCRFVYDENGLGTDYKYHPNTRFLNNILQTDWKSDGITFCGMVHSHINQPAIPSKADIRYCGEILDCFPNLPELYMIIVSVKPTVCETGYYSIKKEGGETQCIHIEIIDMQDA